MTPAEELAKQRKPRRYGTGSACVKIVWHSRVRELRENLGLTMRDVADALGLSVTGLFAIEHGSDPQLTNAMKLAKFYGVDIEDTWKLLKGQAAEAVGGER